MGLVTLTSLPPDQQWAALTLYAARSTVNLGLHRSDKYVPDMQPGNGPDNGPKGFPDTILKQNLPLTGYTAHPPF